MKKETLTKESPKPAGSTAAGSVDNGITERAQAHATNWSGNIRYSTGTVHYPQTREQVQEVVRLCSRVTAVGSRHSFNRIADNATNQVSLGALNKVVSLDTTARTVTVEGGMRYGELAPFLHEHGLALPNLASLPHITVQGACTTATHGSGVKNGNLSTSVSAIELVNAAGDLVSLSREKDGDGFNGAVVGLGALGIVTRLTLDLLPAFDMKQVVYRNLPMEALQNNFGDIQSKGYSVSLFTDWKNRNINEVWIKSRVGPGDDAFPAPELYGATPATENMHPIEHESAVNCTEQLGVPGPWYDRLPHFKMGFKPSAGRELQSEYFVPIEHAYEAMMALERLREAIAPYIFVSEIRTIAADLFWMSPCYRRTCVAFHTTWKQDTERVMHLLQLMEAQLEPFRPVPHWGKLFAMPPAVLQSRYDKLDDFRNLAAGYDPEGKFRNAFLQSHLYGS